MNEEISETEARLLEAHGPLEMARVNRGALRTIAQRANLALGGEE